MDQSHDKRHHLVFQFNTQLSYTPMNLAPCHRSHGLRFEPGTAANRAVFEAQGHADWTGQ